MSRMIAYRLVSAMTLGMLVLSTAQPLPGTEPDAADLQFFESRIRPILHQHCFECHSAESDPVHGGLLLDSADDLARGGDSGTLVSNRQSGAGLLLDAIHYRGDIQMPPEGKLSDRDIALLTEWARRGLPAPKRSQPLPPATPVSPEQGRDFWSFQPLQKVSPPSVGSSDWPQNNIDRFVLSRLQQDGLQPSPPASKRVLVRRLYFATIGLPPTPQQVEAFLADDRPDAVSRLVDELLESPHFGEKWARHWLDLARYTDRTASWLYATGQAHLYRDWVVQAMNDDVPYDQFVHRQLATDLMTETGPEDLPALGFLALSPTYWKELKLPCEIINTIVADEWEERVDAVSRTFLGLTVACARCHDHKFDPITSADYYALAGVFASCRQVERPTIAEDLFAPVREARAKVKTLEAEVARLKKQKPVPADQIQHRQEQIAAIKEQTPHYNTPMANALAEESLHVVRAGKTPQDGTKLDYRPEPRDLPLFVRGNPNRPGPIVPRRFVAVLSRSESGNPPAFQHGSGRLELAQSITTDAAPLAARVIVNRIWAAHFGRGIVATPSNFGTQGERPTHPALLDFLAARFIANGWSLKQLHRDILNSATWQQSASIPEGRPAEIDSDNQLLSRMNRRRLTFEEWRDAILFATGRLDRTMGGRSVDLDAPENYRRTLYGTVHRRDMSTTLTIHDFPDPTQHSPQRSSTTTPLQGLFALNAPLLLQQAEALANRLYEQSDSNEKRIQQAYQILFGRPASAKEQQLAVEFLSESAAPASDAPGDRWIQYAQVLLASNELLYID